MAKLMISIRDENYRLLTLEARERGISIQELIRAVIIPDWVHASFQPKIARESSSYPTFRVEGKENEIPPMFNRTRP